MKAQAKSTQYTVRGIPAEVDRALRRKAKSEKISLNQLLVDKLTAAASISPQHADFSDLVGAWQPDSAFDEIIASQRRIDKSKWK